VFHPVPDDISLDGLAFWEQEVATGKQLFNASIARLARRPEVGQGKFLGTARARTTFARQWAYNAFVRGDADIREIYRVRHEKGHWAWVARAMG
jgi:plasmid stabilization system protein ParE